MYLGKPSAVPELRYFHTLNWRGKRWRRTYVPVGVVPPFGKRQDRLGIEGYQNGLSEAGRIASIGLGGGGAETCGGPGTLYAVALEVHLKYGRRLNCKSDSDECKRVIRALTC